MSKNSHATYFNLKLILKENMLLIAIMDDVIAKLYDKHYLYYYGLLSKMQL